MKPRHHLLAFALLVSATAALAQGSLTPPPGAPAPSMKTLDQLEPRIPLQAGAPGVSIDANGTITISRPGSYYLTGDLTVAEGDGIQIDQTGDVSIDLNGFTISSTAAGPVLDRAAIRIIPGANYPAPTSNLSICNGHIRGTAQNEGDTFSGGSFLNGIYCATYSVSSSRVADITVSGMAMDGLHLEGYSNLISNCNVSICGGTGITANIASDCSAIGCYGNGIVASQVTNCFAESNHGQGIQGQQVANSYGYSMDDTGIQATNAQNSYGYSTNGQGLRATVATNCYGHSATREGIYATISTGCQGVSSSGTGLCAEKTADNCYGETASGRYGLCAYKGATNCSGYNNVSSSTTAYGLYTGGSATGCGGYTRTGLAGLSAEVVNNCQGSTTAATAGIQGSVVTNSLGQNDSTAANTYGIDAKISASFSTGTGIVGIRAIRSANYCHGTTTATNSPFLAILTGQTTPIVISGTAIGCTSTGTITATNKYLMP